VVVVELVIIPMLTLARQLLEQHPGMEVQEMLPMLQQIEVVVEEDTLGIHLVLVVLVVLVLLLYDIQPDKYLKV
jgi:NADH:ubiquinone oxidoreductase subunit 4 (subunit M)